MSFFDMTFDLKDLLYIGGIIFTALGGWFTLKNKVERLKEVDIELAAEDEKTWEVIQQIREWVTAHEKEVSDKRIELEKDMARIRETAIKTDSNQNQLFILVDKMDKKLDRIEIRLEVK